MHLYKIAYSAKTSEQLSMRGMQELAWYRSKVK